MLVLNSQWCHWLDLQGAGLASPSLDKDLHLCVLGTLYRFIEEKEQEMLSFKEWADHFLSYMCECQNQGHGYYNLIFNISRKFESNTQTPWTTVLWNILKPSP